MNIDITVSKVLPTEKEIEKLPPSARIAFAARCGRRVYPTIQKYWPKAPRDLLVAFEAATEFAEKAAIAATKDVSGYSIAAKISTAQEIVDNMQLGPEETWIAKAASTVFSIVAQSAWNPKDAAAVAGQVLEVARLVVRVTNPSSPANVEAGKAQVAAAMRRDFELLKFAASVGTWTDGTGISPEFFGPLWPDGKPEGWPEESPLSDNQDPLRLKFEIAVPSNMTAEQSKTFNSKIADFLTALSAMDASMGGTGLQVLDSASRDTVDVEIELPTDCGDVPRSTEGVKQAVGA